MNSNTRGFAVQALLGQKVGVTGQLIASAFAIAALLFLALYNLTDYPLTWFDEGSHLHVPKTLVRFGVYADYSSDGFRYYGPTVGVGPTVMLPIAAVFRIFGIGLLQARLVMAVYLLAAVYAFYRLARGLGGYGFAIAATALLVTSRGVSLLEYGRQVMGEVPGLFFLIVGLSVWFKVWESVDRKRLLLAGALLGLATVTKNQYLLVLIPALGLMWLANLTYYRALPQRAFLIPGIVAMTCFLLWQVYMLIYLGPTTASENLKMLREQTAGAAMVFSPNLMKESIKYLLSLEVQMGAIVPVLAYGFFTALPRSREGLRWGTLLGLVAVNLSWYVAASVSWPRYAFPGLSIASLFAARFFRDMTNSFQFGGKSLWEDLRRGQVTPQKEALRWAALLWLILMIGRPLAYYVRQIASPPFNAPAAMAAYLEEHVPHDSLIETWEQEMGFLTDHNYHFPPAALLNIAVRHIWLGEHAPAEWYDFRQHVSPDYVLVGPFARWVSLYPAEVLAEEYQLVTTVESSWTLIYYELYAAKNR